MAGLFHAFSIKGKFLTVPRVFILLLILAFIAWNNFTWGVEKGNSKEMFHANLSASIVGFSPPRGEF
jgi:hypothetical protein